MSERIRVFLLAAACALAPVAYAAESATANMDILVQKIKADKKLLVAKNLGLSDEEGQSFWPVYDGYQRDLGKINDRLIRLIKDYADAYNAGPVTDAKAQELVDEYFAIEEAETALKRGTMPKVTGVIGAMRAARYLQIENKIRAAVRYELAEEIPLVE